ncbi:MAG: response regulator transcription factor [Anaerolineae bacterium]|jgi:DNA-binding NarL/FixJ family response regulator|nr:response regulator transcription factor [Anaerolineae bacterium]
MIKVIIADDQAIIRSGLKSLLLGSHLIKVVAEASDGLEAIRLAELHEPDVILMDLKMPAMNGIEATRLICQAYPSTKVLVLTLLEDDEMIFTAIKAGARGYMLKDIAQDALLQAIQTIHGGGVIFSAGIANRVLSYLSGESRNARSKLFEQLTNREQQIIELVAEGLTNHEIAQKLSLSPKTISNNVSNALVKLQIVDRSKLILLSQELGIGRKNPAM